MFALAKALVRFLVIAHWHPVAEGNSADQRRRSGGMILLLACVSCVGLSLTSAWGCADADTIANEPPSSGRGEAELPLNGTLNGNGPPGSACGAGDECVSGVCAGGFCCAGACSGANTCEAAACASGTGACQVTQKPDGASCDDGNACTQIDTCEMGMCSGDVSAMCSPLDTCHVTGVCNPGASVVAMDGGAFTGSVGCAGIEPMTKRGTPCQGVGCGLLCAEGSLDYTFATTPGMVYSATFVVDDYKHNCQDTISTSFFVNGAFARSFQGAGVNALVPVTFAFTATTPSTTLRINLNNDICCGCNGSCDPACNPLYDDLNLYVDRVSISTDLCPQAPAPNGKACDDGSACTPTDSCQAGVCVGNNPVVCPPPADQCHSPGVCDPATGACNNPVKADGTACNDGSACTQTDACEGGVCVGKSHVICPATADECHFTSCDPATGACSTDAGPNGALCGGYPLPASLIHRYSFTADAGDAVGGMNGVLRNGAFVSGGAVVLDGSDDYVTLPIGAALAGLTSATIEAWVTWSGGQTWARIFDFGNGPAVNMFLTPSNGATGAARFAITTAGSGAEQSATAVAPLPAGAQTHVAVTMNVSGSRLYINGELAGVYSGAGLTPASLGNTVNNWLGRSQYAADPYFKGSITEFRIYSAALSAGQIGASFSIGPDLNENGCLQGGKCQAGACGGSAPIVCPASDACHDAGTCAPLTGACAYPNKPNGTACDDSDACTQLDACQAGVCTGDNPVICAPPADDCHVAVCNSMDGSCGYPAKPDGSACDDGDVCTQTDTCIAGACAGDNPVVCPSSADQCHVGSCDPATGACGAAEKADGAACAGDALPAGLIHRYDFTADASDSVGGLNGVLHNGAAVSAGAVMLDGIDDYVSLPIGSVIAGLTSATFETWVTFTTAQNQTWTRIFDFGNGTDINMYLTPANGATGTTRFAITTAGYFAEQQLTAAAPFPTGALTHVAVSLDAGGSKLYIDGALAASWVGAGLTPSSLGNTPNNWLGRSQYPDPYFGGSIAEFRIYSPALSDAAIATSFAQGPDLNGHGCVMAGSCQAGACNGAAPVSCAAIDQCHEAGACDAATGACTNPLKAEDTVCDDGDACTQGDECHKGACIGGAPVTCKASDECHEDGVCDSSTGMCSTPAKSDGASCSKGTCQGGVCIAGTETGGGSDGSGGRGGAGSGGPTTEGGCGCRLVGADDEPSAALAGLALASITLARRRRRR